MLRLIVKRVRKMGGCRGILMTTIDSFCIKNERNREAVLTRFPTTTTNVNFVVKPVQQQQLLLPKEQQLHTGRQV